MLHHDSVRLAFASFDLGEPRAVAGWKLFPMFPTVAPGPSMLTSRTAVERGLARIEELPEAPSVRALRLRNTAPLPVLVRDGDLFVSGRQDRVADRALLAPAGCDLELPVSCVERNRWNVRDDNTFSVCDASADIGLRHRRMTDAREREAPDQQTTWDVVAERRRARGFADAHGSLIEAQRAHDPAVDEAVVALPYVYGSAGLALCHDTAKGARVALAEWFADPTACAEAWTGIVRGALSSFASRKRVPNVSRTEVRALFDALSASSRVLDNSGHGTLWGLSHGRTLGRALAYEGRIVHVVALHA